ncbi:unnamed protein product [Boreogadus saida]
MSPIVSSEVSLSNVSPFVPALTCPSLTCPPSSPSEVSLSNVSPFVPALTCPSLTCPPSSPSEVSLSNVSPFVPALTCTMVNPGGSGQTPATGAGSLSWKRCAGCGGKIADRFLLYTMDSYWHSRCLKCSCCQAQLGDVGSSCYTKSGMILCRNDYIR